MVKVFFYIKYQESVIRYYTSNKYIQYNDGKKKNRKIYNDLQNKAQKTDK